MRLNKIKKYFLLTFVLLNYSILTFSQSDLRFEKHGFRKNTLAGHKWSWEFPLEFRSRFGGRTSTDFDYDSENNIQPFYIGAGVKYALRNETDRGVAFGMGIDYATNNFLRYNFLFDFDFLFHLVAKINNKRYIGESVLANYMFSTIITNVDSKNVKEFYLTINLLQIHVRNWSLSGNLNRGILRKKYPPVLANQGPYMTLTYTFRQK